MIYASLSTKYCPTASKSQENNPHIWRGSRSEHYPLLQRKLSFASSMLIIEEWTHSIQLVMVQNSWIFHFFQGKEGGDWKQEPTYYSSLFIHQFDSFFSCIHFLFDGGGGDEKTRQIMEHSQNTKISNFGVSKTQIWV